MAGPEGSDPSGGSPPLRLRGGGRSSREPKSSQAPSKAAAPAPSAKAASSAPPSNEASLGKNGLEDGPSKGAGAESTRSSEPKKKRQKGSQAAAKDPPGKPVPTGPATAAADGTAVAEELSTVPLEDSSPPAGGKAPKAASASVPPQTKKSKAAADHSGPTAKSKKASEMSPETGSERTASPSPSKGAQPEGSGGTLEGEIPEGKKARGKNSKSAGGKKRKSASAEARPQQTSRLPKRAARPKGSLREVDLAEAALTFAATEPEEGGAGANEGAEGSEGGPRGVSAAPSADGAAADAGGDGSDGDEAGDGGGGDDEGRDGDGEGGSDVEISDDSQGAGARSPTPAGATRGKGAKRGRKPGRKKKKAVKSARVYIKKEPLPEYEVPEDFDVAAAFPEIKLESKAVAVESVPIAFAARFTELRKKVNGERKNLLMSLYIFWVLLEPRALSLIRSV